MENSEKKGISQGFQMFLPGYGKFPYIIWKVAYATFMQIPIHIVEKNKDESVALPGGKLEVENKSNLSKSELIEKHENELIEMVKVVNYNMKIDKGKPQKLYLVCAPNKAFYFDDDKIEKKESIPGKGNLLSMDNRLIGMVGKHYKKNQDEYNATTDLF